MCNNKIKNNQLIDIPKPIHKPTCKPVTSEVQYGGNSEQAQVYTVRSDTSEKFTNTEIVQILQNPNKCKLSHVTPINPKAGEVYVLDWQGDQKKVKDYVTDQYMWVADSTKMHPISGINLVKKYFNIRDDFGQVSSRKVPFSRDFQKTVSYIKDNPFLQLTEYIGDETVYKPRPHGNTKGKSDQEFRRTAPSVMKEISDNLISGNSV